MSFVFKIEVLALVLVLVPVLERHSCTKFSTPLSTAGVCGQRQAAAILQQKGQP